MDVNVKYDGFDIPIENVETVGELKAKLRETDGTNFKEFDFDEWKLCHGEKELDDPKMLLVELTLDGEGITLVKPDEKQKGKEKSRSIYTDKTRYIVFHDFSKFLPNHKIYELKKDTLRMVKGSTKNYFSYKGSQEIGLITKVIRMNDTERMVECISYDVRGHGKILLLTTGDQMDKVQIFHKSSNQTEDLEPLPNPKTYFEKELDFVKREDCRTTTEILNLIEGGEEGAGEEEEDGGEGGEQEDRREGGEVGEDRDGGNE